MENNKINFTEKERTVIAEYIHAYHTDTLILSEAYDLLEALNNHKLIDNYEKLVNDVKIKKNGIAEKLVNILNSTITPTQGDEIMKEYFKQ